MSAEETKRERARNLRYKKAALERLNLDDIQNELYDIDSDCDNFRYYFSGEGDDTLLNALDGDDEE
ncbi:MAG: hypothetical protein Q4C12_08930, partial [Clostridia bacterium]|nr:hypothetical protein [Clostridia bacterium]